MTEQQELDKILTELINRIEWEYTAYTEAKLAILDWNNKRELQVRIDELNSLPNRCVTTLTGSVDQSVIYERRDELKQELEKLKEAESYDRHQSQ